MLGECFLALSALEGLLAGVRSGVNSKRLRRGKCLLAHDAFGGHLNWQCEGRQQEVVAGSVTQIAKKSLAPRNTTMKYQSALLNSVTSEDSIITVYTVSTQS